MFFIEVHFKHQIYNAKRSIINFEGYKFKQTLKFLEIN